MTTASNLVQNIYNILGQVQPLFGLFEATGGSATTFVNSNFANYDTPPELDEIKNQLAIVVRDAGGASASPEGKWSIISGYNDATWTGTIATVTDAIASGDTVMIAKQDKFPIQQVLFAINRGLEELGDLPQNANTSLTTVSGQEQYDVPVAVKRGLKQIWVEEVSGFWTEVTDRRNELTGAGTAGRLFLPLTLSGRSIRLIYDGLHSAVSAYSDTINEYVHPRVATCASVLKLLEWYNRRDENQDPNAYYTWLENQYRDYLAQALAENPILEASKTPRYFSLKRTKEKFRYGWKPYHYN